MKKHQVTITEMKQLNKEAGQHWFSKGAMKFFGTKIVAKPNRLNYFITSEELGSETRYTLRYFEVSTSTVQTVGELGDFGTLEEARQRRNELTN